MDDEKKPSSDLRGLELIIGIIVLYVLFSYIFQNIHQKIDSVKGSTSYKDTESIIKDVKEPFAPLGTGALAIGQAVNNLKATILFEKPGGAAIKSIGEGARGIITDGPIQYLSNTWWRVEYEDGAIGWVIDNALISGEGGGTSEETGGPISTAYSSFRFVSTGVSLLLLVGILYSFIRYYQIEREAMERLQGDGVFFGQKVEEVGLDLPTEENPGRAKWEVVEKHANSDSESDWRLAILEADILLDELVRSQGFSGENLGEKLKGIDRSDFQTLDKAWEAHKIRNTLAHEGVNFPLSQREAQRVIRLFKEVFDEFDYV